MNRPDRQRWLILSHAFNMDGRASSQTITDKIPHILAAGIDVVVLSGVSGIKDQKVEHHQLWPAGFAGIKFELRHVLRRKWGSGATYRFWMTCASLVLFPGVLLEKLWRPVESSWSWYFSAYMKGLSLFRERPFDLIYSTGGAFSAHLAGQALKAKTGVPWLAEVHDPFVTPGKTPQTSHERMQLLVEKIICNEADIAIWFTDQALASAKSRQPQLAGRGRVLLPGIDDPFSKGLPLHQISEKMIIGHFGSLSSTRNLARMVEAFEYLQSHSPHILQEMELHIYGGPLDPISDECIRSSPTRAHFCHFGRVEADPVSGISGRELILSKMRGVDVLLLLHGEEAICEEYIPSKMYEYLWTQRPILAQVHRNGQMTAMLQSQQHHVIETGLEGVSDVEVGTQFANALIHLWQMWKETALPDSGARSPFTTAAAVKQILGFVDAMP